MSITREFDAGASSLDGDELTSALLDENRNLLDQNKRLTRANYSAFGLVILLVAGFVIAYLKQ